MKAGIAGSSPDGVTKPKANASVAMSKLLEAVGDATANLNTIVVGLDAVENGYPKPNGLDISWAPADRVTAARKARKYAVESAIARTADALGEYILAIASLPRFQSIRDSWAAKKETQPIAQKICEIGSSVLGTANSYLLTATILLVHWRNRIVHERSRATLTRIQKRQLHDAEAEIYTKYKSLSVDRLLCHFLEQRPTLKDVSSLTAMTINLVRQIDEKVHECAGAADVNAWLDHYNLSTIIRKVTRETAKEKLKKSVERIFVTHAPELAVPYFKFCFATENDQLAGRQQLSTRPRE